MSGCCGCCCIAFQPRYKRLVAQIFPGDPQDGLIKTNMDKLVFFAMKSPEKLDRIADQLGRYISSDVYRPYRYGFVFIAMEALDTLLVTCHGQSINLFVESYLRTVQKLLEQTDPEIQCAGTASFLKFSNIEEDIPSYHRRYDFFVSKFSSMAHSNNADTSIRSRLRAGGIKGLQGVVRKTISDDLQVNIWENTHMDKIIPSLLFNMSENQHSSQAPESPQDVVDPAVVAEVVFRDVVCRASYGNINAVIRPVLMHLDNHSLWVPNDFAIRCFKIIMYSVQAQYGYVVVQMLMSHLDENSNKDAAIKASIVGVVSETVIIAAGGSIGPSVLEFFHALLRHLRISVDMDHQAEKLSEQEEHFQEAIVNTIGEFANNLPDYQKIEILMFVMGKMPMPTDEENNVRQVTLQTMLLKTLLKVATKYKTVLMTNAFPNAFLEPLLRMSLVKDPGIRKIVQEILQTLIDRHDNTAKLAKLTVEKDLSEMDLSMEQPPRQDVMFMKKNGNLFYWHLLENMQQTNNKVDNYESMYCTMALIAIEMGRDEVITELFRLALRIQNELADSALNITHKCAIQALVASYMHLLCQIVSVPAVTAHVDQVIKERKKSAPWLLPSVAYNRNNTSLSYPTSPQIAANLLFSGDAIRPALAASGYEVENLTSAFTPQPVFTVEDTTDMSKSLSEVGSIITDIESTGNTPPPQRFAEEQVTFDALKKVLENTLQLKIDEERKRKQIYDSFYSGPFEDIVAKAETEAVNLQGKVNSILESLDEPMMKSSTSNLSQNHYVEHSSNIHFPELFVY